MHRFTRLFSPSSRTDVGFVSLWGVRGLPWEVVLGSTWPLYLKKYQFGEGCLYCQETLDQRPYCGFWMTTLSRTRCWPLFAPGRAPGLQQTSPCLLSAGCQGFINTRSVGLHHGSLATARAAGITKHDQNSPAAAICCRGIRTLCNRYKKKSGVFTYRWSSVPAGTSQLELSRLSLRWGCMLSSLPWCPLLPVFSLTPVSVVIYHFAPCSFS